MLNIFDRSALKYFFLCGILVCNVKIPGTPLGLYQIVFPLLLFFSYRNRSRLSSIVGMTKYIWMLIAFWGILLSIYYGFNLQNLKYLLWDTSIIFVSIFMSYDFLDEKKRILIYRTILFLSGIIALSGIYESLTGHFYHETHEKYAIFKNIYGYYRPNTIFFNVNDCAVFMSYNLIYSFLYPIYRKEYKIIRILSLIVFGFNIIMIDSRGAILALILFFFLYFYKALSLFFKILFVFCSFFILLFLSPFQSDFFEMSDRIVIWELCLESLKNSNYLGVGPGMIVDANDQVASLTNLLAPHNFFLELFCDYGFIGLFLSIIWFIYITKHGIVLFYKYNETKLIGMAIAFLGTSITCSSLIGKSFIILFFSIMIAESNLFKSRLQYEKTDC